MCKDFKNPDEGESEDSELADADVYENILVGADDVSLSDLETDGDVELLVEDISDDSFDPNATDSDDSMPGQSDNTEVSQNQTMRPITCINFNESNEQRPSNSVSANEEAGPSRIGNSENQKHTVNVNLEEEDDETVRAIMDAISKPRSIPPEIKMDDFITDICFHPNRDIIAMATITGDIALYKYANESNTLLRNIEVHAKACRDVEFSDDGHNLLSCSKDKSIMVTDMETEKLKHFYESAHDDAINKLYVIDDNLFATGDDNGTVKLWDLRTKDKIFSLKEVEDYITRLLTNDTKKLLLVTSGDGYLTTINIGSRKLYVQSEPYEEELTCMGLYRGDSKLIVGTSKGRLYTYNWGQFGYHCDMYPGVKSPISEMIPITDRIACIAGEEGTIRACHIAPFRLLGVVGQHTMPIETLDVSSNGELIASSSHNNDVRFWNVKYFEEFGDVKYNEKHNTFKEKWHNLPSSKFANASDFFADLSKAPSDDDD